MSTTTASSCFPNGNTTNLNDSTSDSENNCVVTNFAYHFVDMSADVVLVVIHVFICIALIIYRRKLSRNLVDLYAANVVIADTCISIVSTMVAFLNYFGYSSEADNDHPPSDSIYYFSFLLNILNQAMFVVVCVGIGLLIMATKKNMFRVHRSVAGLSQNSIQAIKKDDLTKKTLQYRILHWIQKNPRFVAKFQIIIIWLVPLLIYLASFSNDSCCIQECKCKLSYVPADNSFPNCPFEKGCNILLPGFTNVNIIVNSAVWFFCVSILLMLLLHSYFNFRHVVMERHSAKCKHLRDSAIEKQKKEANEVSVEKKPSRDDNSAIDSSTPQQLSVERGTPERSGRRRHRAYTKNLFSESLKNHILFIVIVAGIFILGTAPTIVVYLISALNPYLLEDLEIDGIFIFLILLRFLTILTNSILLCSAYSGLNAALKSLVRLIAECHCFNRRQ